ncbi:unnamed protein product, partial [Meganyctiphanes norvegica]
MAPTAGAKRRDILVRYRIPMIYRKSPNLDKDLVTQTHKIKIKSPAQLVTDIWRAVRRLGDKCGHLEQPLKHVSTIQTCPTSKGSAKKVHGFWAKHIVNRSLAGTKDQPEILWADQQKNCKPQNYAAGDGPMGLPANDCRTQNSAAADGIMHEIIREICKQIFLSGFWRGRRWWRHFQRYSKHCYLRFLLPRRVLLPPIILRDPPNGPAPCLCCGYTKRSTNTPTPGQGRGVISLTFFCMSLSFLVIGPKLKCCSSRSTPKPRPPSPTTRPNVTFLTYACPPAYAAWYCLNGATCFTVKIGDSILYNCECADGFMGQRCEFKDLDGSYLPAREKVLLETASIAGGATVATVLVFVVLFALYVIKQRDKEKRLPCRDLDETSDRRPFSGYQSTRPETFHTISNPYARTAELSHVEVVGSTTVNSGAASVSS